MLPEHILLIALYGEWLFPWNSTLNGTKILSGKSPHTSYKILVEKESGHQIKEISD